MSESHIGQLIKAAEKMVMREYGSQLTIVYIPLGDHDAYLRVIKHLKSWPIEQQRMFAVNVCLDDIELLRFPAFDIEFNAKAGSEKLGCTGKPKNIEAFMRLL
jgi:hypothetical protein